MNVDGEHPPNVPIDCSPWLVIQGYGAISTQAVYVIRFSVKGSMKNPTHNNAAAVTIIDSTTASASMVKFSRTPHLFRPAHSKAVTDDDLIISKDNALFNNSYS